VVGEVEGENVHVPTDVPLRRALDTLVNAYRQVLILELPPELGAE